MRKQCQASVTRREHRLISQARAGHRRNGWRAASGVLILAMLLTILAALVLGLSALRTCADVTVETDLDPRHPRFVMQVHQRGPGCQTSVQMQGSTSR